MEAITNPLSCAQCIHHARGETRDEFVCRLKAGKPRLDSDWQVVRPPWCPLPDVVIKT